MKALIPWKNRERNAVTALLGNGRLDRVWERPFKNMLFPFSDVFSSRMPSVEVTEGKNEFIVRAETPVMTGKDLELTWHEGVLSIRGNKKIEREGEKKGSHYRESSYG